MTERQKQHRANVRRINQHWDTRASMTLENETTALAHLLDQAERRGENRYKTPDYKSRVQTILPLIDRIGDLESELKRLTESQARITRLERWMGYTLFVLASVLGPRLADLFRSSPDSLPPGSKRNVEN